MAHATVRRMLTVCRSSSQAAACLLAALVLLWHATLIHAKAAGLGCCPHDTCETTHASPITENEPDPDAGCRHAACCHPPSLDLPPRAELPPLASQRLDYACENTALPDPPVFAIDHPPQLR